MILVDTSVWISWANEKAANAAIELDRLLAADDVATTDVVLAELLQGARTQPLFDQWQGVLDALHYFPVTAETWLRAAALSFDFRRNGQTTALSDLLIAQVAFDHDLPVFAMDTDFARVPGLKLHNLKGQH